MDSTSCFTSWICPVSHVKNPVIFHERGEDGMTTRNGTYQWLSMTQTFRNVTVNQVKKEAINLSRCNLNVPTRNPWFCSIFVRNWEIYTSAKYAGAAGMLLNINGKFTIEKARATETHQKTKGEPMCSRRAKCKCIDSYRNTILLFDYKITRNWWRQFVHENACTMHNV